MRLKGFFYFSLLLLLVFASELPAQRGLFEYINYSGSTSSNGMGEEGSALRNGQDAFTFNPANLTYSDRLRLSLYHNQYQPSGFSYPINNYTAAFKFHGTSTLGVQYLKQDFGYVTTTSIDDPDGSGRSEHLYNYALSLGYAMKAAEGLSVGLAVKYAYMNMGGKSWNSLLYSGGLNYQPAILDKRINLGFSLMNMGFPIKDKMPSLSASNREETIWTDVYIPVSSMIHLALSAVPVETDYLSAAMQAGFGKYLISDKKDNSKPSYSGVLDDSRSSFAALFDDWHDFPRDASLSTGFSFEWKPLELGKGFSFYQNFYLGTISPGPKISIGNFYTHGAEIGIGYKEVSILMGYSGRWHYLQGYEYFNLPVFPWETFQFSFEWDINKYFSRESENKTPARLNNIIVSLAGGYNFRSGHMLSEYAPSDVKRNSFSYAFESAFYINRSSALVTALYYTSIPYEHRFLPGHADKEKFETVGINSAYRYHPAESISSFYVQGGPGIVRVNPVSWSYPKYMYKTSLNVAMGTNLELFSNNFIVAPELSYQLMLWPLSVSSSSPRLGGENQLALAVKIGRRF
ncbi:MAG TPA: hypothetical protein VHO03_08540 [Ignavibacteriales bacterium]|nr:hypothetical protein [Ignavibacteriales bacterium]